MSLIVVADDDTNFLEMLQMHFESLGHLVLTAEDVLSLLRQLEGRSPDLYILDVKMPGGGAPGAVNFLAEKPGGAQAPIVIVSSLPIEEQKKRFKDAANLRFLTKPVDLKALTDLVSELLASRKATK